MFKAPNLHKEIQKIIENLENKTREKENEHDLPEFLYLRPDYSREFDVVYFDVDQEIKIFGIKGPEESVYEV